VSAVITKPLPGGPKGHFLLGNLPELRADPLAFVGGCARVYGDFVPLRLGIIRAVLINDPAAIEQVLVAHDGAFVRPIQTRILRRLVGEALITAEGSAWEHQRKLVEPAFDHARVAGYADVVASSAEQLVSTWQDGDERDILREMQRLATNIVCLTLFDSTLRPDELASIDVSSSSALDEIQRFMTSPLGLLPGVIPTSGNLRFGRAVRQLDKIVSRMIHDRRARGRGRDLLGALLDARDADGAPLSARELRDIVTMLLLAGREPAVILTWAWYLLAQHPEELERLEKELETVLGGRSPDQTDLPRLKVAEQIILETLRLYPTGWIIGRRTAEECTIGDYKLPKGLHVLVSPWVIHRDPRFYPDPESFRPARWTDSFAEQLPRYTYFPHSAGSRACLGGEFTRQEAVLALVTIAQMARLSLAPGQVVQPSAVLLRPDGQVRMVVNRRTT
jgi:cytochrome P450